MLHQQPNAGLNRKYLRLHDLRRLSQFVFAPRKIIDGQYSGRHATPQRGHSVEFRDYRQYTPGDDVGSVDWKAYGRSDRLYVKIFESETEMSVTLVVDASASMSYRGQGEQSKYDHACALAAAIGFLVVNQQDRIAFAFSRSGLADYRPHAGAIKQLTAILDVMEGNRPTGKAKLGQAIQQLALQTRRREIVIVFSDLWDDRDPIMKSLARITHRGGEVILFHVMHPDELELPRIDRGLFVDSETQEKIRLHVDDVRVTYRERVREHLAGWQRACRNADVDYCLASTAESFHKSLHRYLVTRAAMT